jgi:hypothetical protein
MTVLIPGAAVQSACPGVIRPDICGSEYNHVPPATYEHPDFHRRACSSLAGITNSRTPAMFLRIFPGLKTRLKCIQMSRYRIPAERLNVP